jgi:hypothetical protein
MTNNQMEIILEAITKNQLSMQRMLLDMEYKLSSKLMTVEELSEAAISHIRRDLKVWVGINCSCARSMS